MTSTSTSRDSIGTTRKTASGNYCETLSAIQRSDQMLSPFSPVIPVWGDMTSTSSNWDSIGNTRKIASGNYCKTWSAIQRSDQKLWPFSAFIPVWRDMTSSSTSRDFIGTTRKTASRNYWSLERDPTVGSKFMAIFSFYSGLARHDIIFNE
jgi:hypothetical protein